MPNIYIIGESLPTGVATGSAQGNLTQLLPLDPRHGVFPNHIACPFFNAILHICKDKRLELIDEIRNMRENGRMLNAFNAAPFVARRFNQATDLSEQINTAIRDQDRLIITVGITSFIGTVFAFLRYNEFINRDFTIQRALEGLGKKNQSYVLGAAFRLCTIENQQPQIPQILERFTLNNDNLNNLHDFIRTCIPFPHNSLYSTTKKIIPGQIQSAFMKGAWGMEKRQDEQAPINFQDFQGHVIARRFEGTFIDYGRDNFQNRYQETALAQN